MNNVVSIRDFSRADIDSLVREALELKKNGVDNGLLSGKKIASLFFENSTRTRVSSETAATDQGGYINGFAGVEGTSVKKGEPLLDTLRMFEGYGYNAVIMRHPVQGAARFAADNIKVPIINGGDGARDHPTQAMLDALTIFESKDTIDGLKIGFVGDLKYGRTAPPWLHLAKFYDFEPWLISPPQLKMSQWRITDYEEATGKKIVITDDFAEAINSVDVLYMTRIQRERFPEGKEGDIEYKKVSGIYNLTASMLKDAKKDMIVLHPLPRYKYNLEVSMDVDKTSNARYLQQAANGRYMRQAILKRVFGEGFEGVSPDKSWDCKLWEEMPITHGTKKGESLIYRLDNGTLIDHLLPGKGMLVYFLLGLGELETAVVAPHRINSKKHGKKDVLAVHDMTLLPEHLYKLALVSKEATVNFIEGAHVIKKGKPVLPDNLEGVLQCQNQNCITWPEHYEHAPSIFQVEKRDPLKVRCHYCDTPMGREEVTSALVAPLKEKIEVYLKNGRL